MITFDRNAMVPKTYEIKFITVKYVVSTNGNEEKSQRCPDVFLDANGLWQPQPDPIENILSALMLGCPNKPPDKDPHNTNGDEIACKEVPPALVRVDPKVPTINIEFATFPKAHTACLRTCLGSN